MVFIRDLVQEAIETGYLSLETEEKIRDLLKICCNDEDLEAFVELQQAVIAGKVQQESREQQAKTNLKGVYQITAIISAATAIALSGSGSIEAAVVIEDLSSSTTLQVNIK